MDAQDLIESIDATSPSLEGFFQAIYARRHTGPVQAVLHFRGGKVVLLEILSSTSIRLLDNGGSRDSLDKAADTAAHSVT
jgi:hypothetical protein